MAATALPTFVALLPLRHLPNVPRNIPLTRKICHPRPMGMSGTWGLPRFFSLPSMSASLLPESTVVEYTVSSGARRVGHVVDYDGKRRMIVEDVRGMRSSVVTRDIEFVIGPSGEVGKALEVEKRVKDLLEGSEGLLEVAWEVTGAGNEVDVGEVAEIVFGSGSGVERYAAWKLIVQDGVWYRTKRGKGTTVEGRTEGGVREIKSVKEAERLKCEKEKRTTDAWREAVAGGGLCTLHEVLGEEMVEKIVRSLAALAERLDKKEEEQEVLWGGYYINADEKIAMEWLSRLGTPLVPISAFEVLVGLGVFNRHENLAFRGTVYADGFPASVTEAANLLARKPVKDKDYENRLDLRHLSAYAIDSVDTTEIDDAVSWEEENNRVWVHIADATRFLDTDNRDGVVEAVRKEALKRGSTLYLPTGYHTMYPLELATKMSLSCDSEAKGRENHALSFGFHVNTAGEIEESSVVIRPTIVNAVTRLTYQEADHAIQQAADLSLLSLSDAASKRLKWRLGNGAIVINTPSTNIKVKYTAGDLDREPTIKIDQFATDTASWRLVSELMITASTLAGSYFKKHNIPGPFRTQNLFEAPDTETLSAIPNDYVRAYVAFRNAGPSTTMSEPRPHASLGVPSYLQITSPIRRSTDTLAHLQLKAHLRDDPLPFTLKEMEAEIGRAKINSQLSTQLERRTNRYWQYEYLRREGEKRVYPAVIISFIRDSNELARVVLRDLGIQLVARVPPYTDPGTEVSVRILRVEPRKDTIHAEATWMTDLEDYEEPAQHGVSGVSNPVFSDVPDNEIGPPDEIVNEVNVSV